MTQYLIYFATWLSTLYNYSVQAVDGSTINLSSLQGRRVLLVNTAGSSSQIAQLEQLQQQHGDSLTIIVFPSNSFGNEPRDSAVLAQWAAGLNLHVRVAVPCQVTGTGKHPVYQWLQTEGISITKDFQKVLVGKGGRVTAVFGSRVSPTDAKVQQAITKQY